MLIISFCLTIKMHIDDLIDVVIHMKRHKNSVDSSTPNLGVVAMLKLIFRTWGDKI